MHECIGCGLKTETCDICHEAYSWVNGQWILRGKDFEMFDCDDCSNRLCSCCVQGTTGSNLHCPECGGNVGSISPN